MGRPHWSEMNTALLLRTHHHMPLSQPLSQYARADHLCGRHRAQQAMDTNTCHHDAFKVRHGSASTHDQCMSSKATSKTNRSGMVGRDGFEPSTNGLKVHCSTTELTARMRYASKLHPPPCPVCPTDTCEAGKAWNCSKSSPNVQGPALSPRDFTWSFAEPEPIFDWPYGR